MATSIKKHFKFAPVQEQTEFNRMFSAVLTDLTALRTSITGITAKLDADAGVTDTDYASLHDPAVLELVE